MNVFEVPEFFSAIEAVANDEYVVDLGAEKGDLDLNFSAGRF